MSFIEIKTESSESAISRFRPLRGKGFLVFERKRELVIAEGMIGEIKISLPSKKHIVPPPRGDF